MINRDYNRREQIIFGCDLDEQNDEHFQKEYNRLRSKDVIDRDEESAIFSKYYVGGVKGFENMSISTLKQLLKEGFIRGESRHNDSPTVNQMLKFADSIRELEPDMIIKFEGFATSPSHGDGCVSIDGITFESRYHVNRRALDEFWKFIKSADEVSMDDTSGRGWWD